MNTHMDIHDVIAVAQTFTLFEDMVTTQFEFVGRDGSTFKIVAYGDKPLIIVHAGTYRIGEDGKRGRVEAPATEVAP